MALRMGINVQLFDLAAKKKLKVAAMPEAISFWRWVSDSTLGIITVSAVYHWSLSAEEPNPVLMFDRHESLANTQVIGYCADRSEKWLCVNGIAADPSGAIVGRLQLYSVDQKMSQALPGHAAAFAYLQMASYKATLFAFASREQKPDSDTPDSRFRVIEISGSGEFQRVSSDIYYPPEYAADFPVAVHASTRYATIVYMITKMGYVHMYDLETASAFT